MSNNSSKKWTSEQLAAIRTRGCHLLVSAAAGAGKTAVLVERILERIKDSRSPVDIDRLLVVTFTSAAAAEMRERIASAISAELSAEADGGRLGLQLALLGRARISTIHSFCMDVIKQYFYQLDMDPGFRLADETESMMLRADVFEELMEQKYSGDQLESGFTEMVECYGGELDDGGLMDLVLRIYDFSRSNPDPRQWLEKAAGRYIAGQEEYQVLPGYAAVVLSGVFRTLEGAAGEMELALNLCKRPGGPVRYAPTIEEEMAMLRDLAGACKCGWDQAYQAFREVRFGSLKSAGSGVDEGLKDMVADLRNRVKRKVKDLSGGCLSRPLADHAADMEKLAPVMGALSRLVMEFADQYRLAKQSRGLVDFSDLEHYCLQILTEKGPGGGIRPSAVALELREQFAEVLVDEYQDINPVQEAIINLVSRPPENEPNLFMVGDVKQSIYRFRLAEPGLFLEKYRNYPVTGGGSCRRIDLSKNFRSRRSVVDAVNYIFRSIMIPEAVEIDYGPGAELICGAVVYEDEKDVDQDRRVELILLDRGSPLQEDGRSPEDAAAGDDAGEFSDQEEISAVEAEAALIARRIRELVESGYAVYDESLKSLRPVMFRDIVILLRTVKGWSGVFVDELKRLGIPAYSEPDAGYFQSTEIEIMISLLKLVDNPRQDIPLAAVLRSPIVGLGAKELAQVRVIVKTGDLWDAVVSAANSAPGELGGRLNRFIHSLNRWRDLSRRAAMTDLIWTIYRETGYYHYAGAMPGGADRQANLRALHHWAGQYEATTFRGVFSFLRFIDRMREKGEDPGRARNLGENENLVRIMSIHKSKGLEFPVVVVAGLGKQFNMKDLYSNILLHRELGFGPSLVDTAARITYTTLPELAVRERLRSEALAEEMRVLYVAMTRAREKLIMSGAAAGLQRACQIWTNCAGRGIFPSDILSARSYLDWICPVLAGHGDGGPLRTLAIGGDTAGGTEHDTGQEWRIRIVNIDAIAPVMTANQEVQGEAACAENIRLGEKVETDGRYAEVVNARLSWRYPYRGTEGKPAKVSVTGLEETLSHRVPDTVNSDEEAPAGGHNLSYLKPAYLRPAFLTARKKLNPAERGSAVHLVMSRLDLGGKLDAEGIGEQVKGMVDRELITEEQAAVVDCGKIAAFFQTGLGQRVLNAGTVKREVPFSLAVPAADLYPELKDSRSGERVLVQGVIDCLADEGEGYLLIDYKTDHIIHDDLVARAEKYRFQLNFYARAVETLTGRPVLERYLYFVEPGMEYRV